MLPGRVRRAAVCAGMMLLGLCSGCGPRNVYAPPPPPEVFVAAAEQRSITLYREYTGTTQASESVQIKSRVAGYLDSIHFRDGATVSKGDLLFVIDPRPYQSQLDQAKADLAGKKAAAVEAETVYKRLLAELPSGAATQQDVDVQEGNLLVAKAAVMQAEAAVRLAQLNLEYTEIRAPISGKIGRRLVDVGNLVSLDSTVLTSIARYHPMYAYFTVSESDFLDFLKWDREKRQGVAGKQASPSVLAAAAGPWHQPDPPPGPAGPRPAATAPAAAVSVELGLSDESGYPHQGIVDFADNTVDPATGTLLVRGVFTNPEPYRLAPGLFVRIRLPVGTRPGALLVPESALAADQAGRYLLVVRFDNVVEHRSVTVGPLVDGKRVIEQGLKPGERFIVEGLQLARQGTEVKPTEKRER